MGRGGAGDGAAVPSVDPVEALRVITAATGGAVTHDDFVPVAVARVFELLFEVRYCQWYLSDGVRAGMQCEYKP